MYIEELKEGDGDGVVVTVSNTKRVLVGAGARALFYPTLLYNVFRNKFQTEFRWWDRVDQFVLLGAVPFPTDVFRLKEVGVCGVVTLNESYETLVPTSLYHAHGIDHLVIPTRDYLFAPSHYDICKAVEFIHGNASAGKTTYVHCKAGRGRSTTIVLCYLVKYKQMTPGAAYQYVKSIRPRVRLASSQWRAVQDYYYHDRVKKPSKFEPFDDAAVVFVAESDLEGYKESFDSGVARKHFLAELSVVCRAQFVSQAAIARLSCLWLRCHEVVQKIPTKDLATSEQMGGDVGIDIRVH
ncbi:phosphotyrosine protein phosphatases superfamily protein [Artemisia annua]|uniref:phosphatidylglycerophosphatase n=1 Tax=Artemisia annua TaxID=35608 RepID=A0A2U1MP50_ARTAN|nr:phosphotyrosine protein phosphatases superfamily protein [Artemisia annua]